MLVEGPGNALAHSSGWCREVAHRPAAVSCSIIASSSGRAPAGDHPLKRIHIVGSSGTGKSTLSKRLSEILAIPHIELDAIHHLPNWEPIPRAEFAEIVDEKTDADAWIVDGNYRRLRPIIWSKATHLIWLDFSFPFVMYRCVRRTVKRVVTKEELFNGNRETFRNAFLSGDSVIWYTLHNHFGRRRQYRAVFESDEHHGMNLIRLRSQAEVDQFLRTVRQEAPD